MTTSDALGDFLAAADLDAVADARAELPEPDAAAQQRIGEVIDAWSDRQAVANLLLCPDLIPADRRADAVERALRGDDDYLALAAAAGAGVLGADHLTEVARARLVAALLDLAASVDGIVARRAAASLASLVNPLDAADLITMLLHPDEGVRRNIVCALLPLLGSTSLAKILADRDEVSEEDAADAAEALTEDGVDLSAPASELRVLPVLDYLPNLADWA